MMTRDQKRAELAYKAVGAVPKKRDYWDGYKVLVNSLGPNVVRSGLVGALAFVQRYKPEKVRERFGTDLAKSFPSTLNVGDSLSDMFTRVKNMDLDTYMVTTRECLYLAQWFKRAMQARDSMAEDDSQAEPSDA